MAGNQNNQKIVILITISLAAIAALAGGLTYTFWPSDPPPPDSASQEPEVVGEYLASRQFGQLPTLQKQQYLEALRKNGGMRNVMQHLNDKHREQARENIRPVHMKQMENRLTKYFELSPEERKKHLDGIIDWREARRREPEAKRQENENASAPPYRPGRGRRHNLTPERLKRMIEKHSPETRAKFMQLRKDMRARRVERGLPACGHP